MVLDGWASTCGLSPLGNLGKQWDTPWNHAPGAWGLWHIPTSCCQHDVGALPGEWGTWILRHCGLHMGRERPAPEGIPRQETWFLAGGSQGCLGPLSVGSWAPPILGSEELAEVGLSSSAVWLQANHCTSLNLSFLTCTHP